MEGFEKFKKDTYDLCILCNDAKDTLWRREKK
jgi:hypothetical protein